MRPIRSAKSRRHGSRAPMSGPPEIVLARRKEAIRQAGIAAAKAAAEGRRERLREAFSYSPKQ